MVNTFMALMIYFDAEGTGAADTKFQQGKAVVLRTSRQVAVTAEGLQQKDAF